MIEMGDFFAEDEIFQQCGTARMGPERVLIIGKCNPLVGGEWWVRAAGSLMQLAACSPLGVTLRRTAFFLLGSSGITGGVFFFAHE